MEQGQYGQHVAEGNPSSYMSMRDYINQSWQSQQPVERNPSEYRSMGEYRDQWMSAPSYMLPPQYASLSQPQPPQPISLVEQAIIDLTKLVGDAVVEQKEFNAQLSQKIHAVENPLEQKLDGFQSEMGQQFDSLQCSISKLAQEFDQKREENPEDECLTETIFGELVQLHPQEELKVESVEAPEELQDALESDVTFWPWKKEEHISALITEEGSGIEAGKETQKLTLQPIPLKMNPTATAQATKCPLPVAPSTDQVYILLATKSQHKTPEAPTTKANPSLLVLQNIRKLVSTVQASAITPKTQAVAYIAWHGGWFGCRFGFGSPEPWHF